MAIHIKTALRVDQDRLNFALDTADFIVDHHDDDGAYHVSEHWGPEGEIYRAICVWALLDAYEVSQEQKYLDKSKTILERFKKRQCKSGGWTISLGSDGMKFKITDDERDDSNVSEDPVIAGAVLKSISDYQSLTNESEFQEMGDKAFEYLMSLWDAHIGTINENRDRHLSSLRSNPDAYHFLILLGINAWSETGSSQAKEVLPQIIGFVQQTFEKFDNETMPLMIGYHVAVLTKFCSPQYSSKHIKPTLDMYMKSGLFSSNDISGGYGHRDGLRGIVKDELHMRSAIGLAYAMKSYDLNTGTVAYTETTWYKDLCFWIDSMKSSEGGFFEYQVAEDRSRCGKGSAGQYLPVLWILGTLLK